MKSARLRGTPVGAHDLPYVVSVYGDVAVQRTLSGVNASAAQSEARLEPWLAHWRDHGFGYWIFRNREGDIVGHAGLFHSKRHPGAVELGYVIVPQYWGAGYATEMARATLTFAFDVLELASVVAR